MEQVTTDNKAYNNALSYTIATSEYRSLLHGVSIIQAMVDTQRATVIQTRLQELEDALRYELMDVFGVATDKGELAKAPLVAFDPTVVKDLNTAYQIGLGQDGESKYPLFTQIAKLRQTNPNTVATHSLITTALAGIESLITELETAHIDDDQTKVDVIINLILQWVDVLICHPSKYRDLGNMVLIGMENGVGGFSTDFIDLFLGALTDISLPMVFGDEALSLVLKETNKLN